VHIFSTYLIFKTDEVDAESLMLMYACGLLKPGSQVDNCSHEICNSSRHRDSLTRTAAKEVQHVQKSMDLMNIRLSNVTSDLTGKSGQDIIRAILSGKRDAQKPADLADSCCKTPKETVAKSLVGNWNEDLLFALKQSDEPYQFIQKQITECECRMENLFKKYSSHIPPENRKTVRSKKQIQR
jgi:DNA-binding protein YbaB